MSKDVIQHIADEWGDLLTVPQSVSPTDKPYDIADFRAKFPKQAAFGDKIDRARYDGKRLIVVKGKVKSGKSLFPRYISLLHIPIRGWPNTNNYFLSSYNRKSDRGQYKEHTGYGLNTYPLYNTIQVQRCLADIVKDLMAGRAVILHIDELDYGSGWRGLLSQIWNAVKNTPKVMCVLYSATSEELLKSDTWTSLPDSQKALFNYEPVEEYCGDLTFLQNGLIEDAEPAFTVRYDEETPMLQLGTQFRELLKQVNANVEKGDPRYIIVLRLCYELPGYKGSSKKDKRAFKLFLNCFDHMFHTKGFRIIYDKENAANISVKHASPQSIDWGNRAAWDSSKKPKPTILLIDSKCTRSTEIKFHDLIYAWHEWRPAYCYTISVQAEQRVVHYRGKAYPTFNPIRVFGNLDTWLRSADLITDNEYLRKDTEIRIKAEADFDPAKFVELLRQKGFAGTEYLKKVAHAIPALQFFRIASLKDDTLTQLQALLESKKTSHKFSNFFIKERDNIDGIAPRVASEHRGAEVQLEKEFFQWPMKADGTYEEYGHYSTEGTLAHAIDRYRQEIMDPNASDSDEEASDDSAASNPKHFRALKLKAGKENDLSVQDRKKFSAGQIHTKAEDGRYISLFKSAGEDGLHNPCTYEEIKDATTGKEDPRQTLIYKGEVLGVFVRIPTGELKFNASSETTGASMFANNGRGPGRGRGRGLGRGRGK
jgi:hypothetical protein